MNKGLSAVAVAGIASAIVLLSVGAQLRAGENSDRWNLRHVFAGWFCKSSEAQTSMRSLPWQGGNSIEIRIPGSIRYVPASEWRIDVSGPKDVIEHLRLHNGVFDWDESL